MSATTSLPGVFAGFDELWSPRLVAQVNDHEIKIVKIDGGFIWHLHPDTDELFYLLEGELTMEMEALDRRPADDHNLEESRLESGETLSYYKVQFKVGDLFVVPRGVRHRPVASNARILVVERAGTVNTGDAESDRTRQVKDARSSA